MAFAPTNRHPARSRRISKALALVTVCLVTLGACGRAEVAVPDVPARVVNEFPLRGLRVIEVQQTEAEVLLTSSLKVLRHSTNPLTFDPTDLEFQVTTVSGTEVTSESEVLHTLPDPNLAEVTFRTIVPKANMAETELDLQVSLGSQQIQTRFRLNQ